MPTATEILLAERREEGERVISLIDCVEEKPVSERECDDIPDELSAAVPPLSMHTARLDEFLWEVEEPGIHRS